MPAAAIAIFAPNATSCAAIAPLDAAAFSTSPTRLSEPVGAESPFAPCAAIAAAFIAIAAAIVAIAAVAAALSDL